MVAQRNRHAAHLQACGKTQLQLQAQFATAMQENNALQAQATRLQAEADGLRDRFVYESDGLL